MRIESLAAKLERHTREDGRVATAIDGLHLYRVSAPTPIQTTIYEPCVIIVGQGAKSGTVGGHRYEYSPARYLVLPVALPILAQVTEATPDRPFLSLSVTVDPRILADVVDQTGASAPRLGHAERGIAVSEVTGDLLDAADRLVGCLDSEADSRVLGRPLVREVLYRVLIGPQGDLLRGVGFRDARLGQVARAIRVIHAEYDRPIEVGELARVAHMSQSTFYEAFKAVTALSPLQYVKEIRLNRARQIMLWEGATAKRAAARVGYRSPNQFSREFKRRFGRPPAAERARAVEAGEVVGTRPY